MKKALKTSLLFVLSICMLLSVAFLSFSLTSSKAYADETQEIFQMEKGASVATTKDGLRFMVNMNGAVYQKLVTDDVDNKMDLSVLIAPKSYYDELTDSEYMNLIKCVKVDIDEDKIYSYNGLYHANVLLTNLNAENNANITVSQFDYNFIAVGCITDNSGSEPTYQYTTLNDGETLSDYARSQYKVINTLVLTGTEELADLLLGTESPYTWFAREDYPIIVENLDLYENLVAKINAGVVFDQKSILISSAFDKAQSSVEFDDGKGLPLSANNYHVITFKMLDGQEIVKTVIDGQTLTDIPVLSEEDDYVISWDKEIVEIPTESTTYTETKTAKPLPELEVPILADFAVKGYASTVSGANAEVINYEGEGSVLKVTLEVNGWTYFNLNLPQAPTEEKITVRFMVPTRTGGLEINGGDAYYSFTEGEWASYSRNVGSYGSSLKVGAYSSTTRTFEIYFSLVVDGEKTNEEMRNMKLFGNIPEGYLADYSSEAYASLITAGSWGTTIETEYMPTHAEETNVMKISATTKAGANSNAGIRLFLPKASTTNKVTVKYMIDESYGIAGELHAVVKGEYTNKISTLSKAKGVWITEEIDLTNQTEKDVVELYFWQGGTGVTAVIYVSFVYDGILN